MKPHKRQKINYNNYKKPLPKSETDSQIPGLRVQVYNGNVEKALRKFKKKVSNDGKLITLQNRRYYTKPSVKRKQARDIARKRHMKELEEIRISNKRYY